MVEGQPKVAVVTGGASGIGYAISQRLIAAGLSVVVADVNLEAAERAVQDFRRGGSQGLAVALDVTNEASIERARDQIHQRLGDVSYLVNNAGVGSAGTALTTTTEEFRRILEVNVMGPFLVSRAFLPDMIARNWGAIVNVGSIAGTVGIRDRAAYSASKGAVLAFTRSLHADFHQAGIRVNAVVPGTVETPWVERITANDPDPAAAIAKMAERQPIGRMGTPKEIAEAVWFLLSPENSFSYGSLLVVDGGMTAL